MAGAGDTTKGAEALKGVSIPMFSAKGLAIKRANGEVVTPFYFAYEDLREDWGKLVEQAEAASADGSEDGEKSKSVAKKLAAKPKVENRINCSRPIENLQPLHKLRPCTYTFALHILSHFSFSFLHISPSPVSLRWR